MGTEYDMLKIDGLVKLLMLSSLYVHNSATNKGSRFVFRTFRNFNIQNALTKTSRGERNDSIRLWLFAE